MDSGVQVISITYKKSSFCHTNFEFKILSYLLYCNSPYLTSRHTFMWNKYIDKNISYYNVPIRSSKNLVNFNFNIFLRTSRSVMLTLFSNLSLKSSLKNGHLTFKVFQKCKNIYANQPQEFSRNSLSHDKSCFLVNIFTTLNSKLHFQL